MSFVGQVGEKLLHLALPEVARTAHAVIAAAHFRLELCASKSRSSTFGTIPCSVEIDPIARLAPRFGIGAQVSQAHQP